MMKITRPTSCRTLQCKKIKLSHFETLYLVYIEDNANKIHSVYFKIANQLVVRVISFRTFRIETTDSSIGFSPIRYTCLLYLGQNRDIFLIVFLAFLNQTLKKTHMK